jgi:hypothetical protein
MMPGGTGGAVARLFQGISGLLQPLANRSFGSLGAMLNGLAGLGRGFLDGITSFFDWTLILCSHGE